MLTRRRFALCAGAAPFAPMLAAANPAWLGLRADSTLYAVSDAPKAFPPEAPDPAFPKPSRAGR